MTRKQKERIVDAIIVAIYVFIVAIGIGIVKTTQPPVVPASDYQSLGSNLAALPAGKYDVNGGDIVILGAVIRMGSPMPYIHENTAHGAVGVESVSVNKSGDLVVLSNRPKGAQIVYASADEDETLSRLGIQCGVSGGVDTSTVKCYRSGKHIGAKNSMYGSTGNIWFVQIMFVPDGA
jgi:hypothetical protein